MDKSHICKNICILIATYKESDNINELLQQLASYDVIIIDDNSPDGTADICKQYSNTDVIVRTKERGIGSAYITGFKCALKKEKYDYIVQMDAGLTHDPKNISVLLQCAKEKNSDLVVASRNINSQKIVSYRTVLSKTALNLMKLIGIKQSDVTTGFRCWKSSFLKKIPFDFITSNGFAFQLQMIYCSNYLSNNISEISTEYKLTNSSLRFSIVVDAFKVWWNLFLEKYYYHNYHLKK
jgi:dolichol-phosphate mannosyltransferase